MKRSPVEHEIDPTTGERTGRTRGRQFTETYALAARAGVWPKDRAAIDTWMVPFQ